MEPNEPMDPPDPGDSSASSEGQVWDAPSDDATKALLVEQVISKVRGTATADSGFEPLGVDTTTTDPVNVGRNWTPWLLAAAGVAGVLVLLGGWTIVSDGSNGKVDTSELDAAGVDVSIVPSTTSSSVVDPAPAATTPPPPAASGGGSGGRGGSSWAPSGQNIDPEPQVVYLWWDPVLGEFVEEEPDPPETTPTTEEEEEPVDTTTTTVDEPTTTTTTEPSTTTTTTEGNNNGGD